MGPTRHDRWRSDREGDPERWQQERDVYADHLAKHEEREWLLAMAEVVRRVVGVNHRD
jgi:hypothetical protein